MDRRRYREAEGGANLMLAQMTTIALLAHHDGPWDSEWWWAWRLGMFLFWILVIALLFFAVRRWGWGRRELSASERAKGILAERFARGEIGVEEYHQRIEQLRD
jgi:putative membrane protein